MAEKRPFSRPALQSLPTNLPVKKPKHDSKKNDETTTKKVLPLKKNSLVHKLSERSTRGKCTSIHMENFHFDSNMAARSVAVTRQTLFCLRVYCRRVFYCRLPTLYISYPIDIGKISRNTSDGFIWETTP